MSVCIHKISVIVPVYNSDKYLHRCIDSILAQTFIDFELLLINDGSKDNSGAICDEYAAKDARVCVFHKENGGVSSARNVGLDNANGEWICWVDSDDYIDSTMLEKLYKSAVVNDADISYCNFNMVWDKTMEIYRLRGSSFDKFRTLAEWIGEPWTICTASLFKTSLYKDNNLEYSSEFNYCEDFYMSTVLRYYAQRIVNIEEPLYFYNRCNESSITSSPKNVLINDLKKAYLSLFSFFIHKNEFDKYKKYLYWRIIDSQQYWLLNSETFSNYMEFIPESLEELWSCPTISFKRKIMIWCIIHRMSFLANIMLNFYNIKKNQS